MSEIIAPQHIIDEQKELAQFDEPPPEADVDYVEKATQLPQVNEVRRYGIYR